MLEYHIKKYEHEGRISYTLKRGLTSFKVTLEWFHVMIQEQSSMLIQLMVHMSITIINSIFTKSMNLIESFVARVQKGTFKVEATLDIKLLNGCIYIQKIVN